MDAVFHLDAVSRAEYLQLLTHSLVPGFAFTNSLPYIELRELDLQNRGSNQTQRQFYQEAGIKRAVFMGCRSGEIELGLSNVVQLNMEIEMTRFFPEDFPRQLSHVGDPFPQPADLNRPSSFSSSLRSLSTGSPIEPTPSSLQPMSSSIDCSCQQAMQALTQMQSNIQLPMLERENASITRAILAVLTSSTSHLPRKNQNLPYNYLLNPKATAFKRYVPRSTPPVRAGLRSQSILKRATLFYRKFTLVRRSEQLKDKASILFNSRQYLTSLKAQVAELSKQNQLLQARILPAAADVGGSSNESLNIRIIPIHESTSEQRIVDLRISVRGEVLIENILMRLLEFLRHDRNVSIMSIEANNQLSEGSVNYINLRLRIE
ncbi:HLH domain-containing protein [Gossypium australe]|uniref:HLH domain-containing protein n=1 Tax=Gossypium australe TaxID=47621 RepID=A0A5B6W5M1_9ROSI|nr:HLH domain-containing protein [Gossypium australe]